MDANISDIPQSAACDHLIEIASSKISSSSSPPPPPQLPNQINPIINAQSKTNSVVEQNDKPNDNQSSKKSSQEFKNQTYKNNNTGRIALTPVFKPICSNPSSIDSAEVIYTHTNKDDNKKTLALITQEYAIPIPPFLIIKHKLHADVEALYSADQKITFQKPPKLKGIVVNNLFNASLRVQKQNKFSFPFSEWVIEPKSTYWTPWLYEKRISETAKNKLITIPPVQKGIVLRNDSNNNNNNNNKPEIVHLVETTDNNNNDGDNDGDDNNNNNNNDDEIDDDEDDNDANKNNIKSPLDIEPTKWTSEIVALWISSQKTPVLKLHEITHFRRYGQQRCFEFLCHFFANNPTENTTKNVVSPCVQVWVKYSDLMKIGDYEKYVKERWDIKIESDCNYEVWNPLQDFTTEWSDAEDNDEGNNDVRLLSKMNKCGNDKAKLDEQLSRLSSSSSKDKKKSSKCKTKSNPLSKKRHVSQLDDDNNEFSDEISDGFSADEDSFDENEEDSDEERLKKTKQSQKIKKLKWEPIFGYSSVSPAPRFVVKKFRITLISNRK